MKFNISYPKEPPTRKLDIPKAIYKAMRLSLEEAKAIAGEEYFHRAATKGAPPIPKKLTYRTGELLRSITHNIKRVGRKHIGLYGTAKVYGRTHELGEGGHPKRPFLEPSLKDVIPKLIIRVSGEIDRQKRTGL